MRNSLVHNPSIVASMSSPPSNQMVKKIILQKQDLQQLNTIKKLNAKFQQEQELIEKFNILNWNNHKFSYTLLDTTKLKNPFTDQNQKFQECIKMIEDYNKDMKYCLEKKYDIKNGPQKNKFYGTLQNLCFEVLLTENDRQLQNYFTEKIYKWATDNWDCVNGKQDKKNQQKNQVYKSCASIGFKNETFDAQGSRVNTEMSTIDVSDSPVKTEISNLSYLDTKITSLCPSDKKQQQEILEPYENEHRTKHTDIPPPNERLQQFRKKKLNLEPRSKTLQNVAKKQILNNSILYPKPTGYIPVVPVIETPYQSDENKTTEQFLNQQNNVKEQQIDEKSEKNEKVEKDIIMTPIKRSFVNHLTYLTDVKHGIFDQQNTFLTYVPEDILIEQRMEQKWLNNRQKDIEEKRENQEIREIMGDWIHSKSKIDQEIYNKINRQRDGSNYTECKYRPRVMTLNHKKNIYDKINSGANNYYESETSDGQDKKTIKLKTIDYSCHLPNINQNNNAEQGDSLSQTERLEYKISKQRVKNARSIYEKLLNLLPKEDEDVVTDLKPSISVYQQQIQVKNKNAFSTIFDRYTPEFVRNEQLKEIQDIKNRMAKYKINIPLKKLMDSLVIPERLQGKAALNNLPAYGLGLMENPIQKEEKNKKKK